MIKRYTNKYALLVGIKKSKGGSELKYPENDIDNLQRVLLRRGFKPGNVITVPNQGSRHPIRPKSILKKIDEIVNLANRSKDSLLIFHFSGHGKTTEDGRGQLLMEYVPEGELHLLTDHVARSLSHHEGRTLVIIDACNVSDLGAILSLQQAEPPTEPDAEGQDKGMEHDRDGESVRTTWAASKKSSADWIVASTPAGVTREYHNLEMGMLSYAVLMELLQPSSTEYSLSYDGLIEGIARRYEVRKELIFRNTETRENYIITDWPDSDYMQSGGDVREPFGFLRTMSRKQLGDNLEILAGELRNAADAVKNRIQAPFDDLLTYVKLAQSAQPDRPRELLRLRIEHRLRLLIEVLRAEPSKPADREALKKIILSIESIFDKADKKSGNT